MQHPVNTDTQKALKSGLHWWIISIHKTDGYTYMSTYINSHMFAYVCKSMPMCTIFVALPTFSLSPSPPHFLHLPMAVEQHFRRDNCLLYIHMETQCKCLNKVIKHYNTNKKIIYIPN